MLFWGAIDMVSGDYIVVVTKITAIVPEITTMIITIAQRILYFFLATLENGEEDEEFEEPAVTRVVARVAKGGVLKLESTKGCYKELGIERKGAGALRVLGLMESP